MSLDGVGWGEGASSWLGGRETTQGPMWGAATGQRRQNFPEAEWPKEGVLEEVVFDSRLRPGKEGGEGRARRNVSRPRGSEAGQEGP